MVNKRFDKQVAGFIITNKWCARRRSLSSVIRRAGTLMPDEYLEKLVQLLEEIRDLTKERNKKLQA